MKLPWNTYNFTHRCHAQSTSFHALFTKNWLDYDKFLSVHSSENKIKVHVTCERCFPFLFTPVRLWSLHSFTNVVAYKGHSFPVWALDISPQCLYFATGSQDRTARLWNLEYTFPLRIFAGHLQDVDVSASARYRVLFRTLSNYRREQFQA